MWSEVDVNFMTEESSTECDNEVKQHKLPWRSSSGSNYLKYVTLYYVYRIESTNMQAGQEMQGHGNDHSWI